MKGKKEVYFEFVHSPANPLKTIYKTYQDMFKTTHPTTPELYFMATLVNTNTLNPREANKY